jgi:two-component system response regulator MprA
MESNKHQASKILLVDDDEHLLDVVSRGLALNGFVAETARNAEQALRLVESFAPRTVVLDIMMPGFDGLQLCELLRRKHPMLAILMLTALDSVPDKLAGFSAGADDYLAKPFALEELIARVTALLRRTSSAPQEEEITFEDISLHVGTWSASRAGASLPLTAKEFRILELLIRAPKRVYTREQILNEVWKGEADVESNVVEVHVGNLRQKLEAGARPRVIQTVRGVGYVLRNA